MCQVKIDFKIAEFSDLLFTELANKKHEEIQFLTGFWNPTKEFQKISSARKKQRKYVR